jgi:hypothetical protein
MADEPMDRQLARLVAQGRDLFERGRTFANSAEVTQWVLDATDTLARWTESGPTDERIVAKPPPAEPPQPAQPTMNLLENEGSSDD